MYDVSCNNDLFHQASAVINLDFLVTDFSDYKFAALCFSYWIIFTHHDTDAFAVIF